MMEDKQQKTIMQKSVNIDPTRVAPLYVSTVTISFTPEHKVFLMGLFSGMPLPSFLPISPSGEGEAPAQQQSHFFQEQFIGAFFLDVYQAKYLYRNLRDYLKAAGALEEEGEND